MDVIKKLRDELDALEYEFKNVLPKVIREAASLGDLSENAEYDAARQRQRWVDARMGQLQQRIQALSLIDLKKIPTDRVAYGSTVELEDIKTGEAKVYRIVHPEEVDAPKGLISALSPVGQSLQGKRQGEDVVIRTPAATREYVITRLTTIHDQDK
jgi:transcription elongation factor GreA